HIEHQTFKCIVEFTRLEMVVGAAASHLKKEVLQPLKSPRRHIHEHKTGQTIDDYRRYAQGHEHPAQTDPSRSEHYILTVHRQPVKRQCTPNEKSDRQSETADRRQCVTQQAHRRYQIEMVAENETKEPEQLIREEDKRRHNERQDKCRPEFT